MVKIIDAGQTKRAPGLYRVAKDYVIKERSMRILTEVQLTIVKMKQGRTQHGKERTVREAIEVLLNLSNIRDE